MVGEQQTPYPWYAVVNGNAIEQGEYLQDCPVLEPSVDFIAKHDGGAMDMTADVGVRRRNVIVLTQSCDLQNGKAKWVVLCPVWSLSRLAELHEHFRSARGKEELRRGNLPGYHLLNAPTAAGFDDMGMIVADFRTIYSLPFEFITRVALQRARLRLLPPYREHLAQAFARFFMRIGLPTDIPPFR